MRTRALLLTLLLAACSQPAPTTSEANPPSPDTEIPSASDLLANAPLAGVWESVGDGAMTAALFTPTDYPSTLAIGCNNGNLQAFITWSVADPTVDGELRVSTAAGTVAFPATASNYDGHLLSVDVAGDDPRLAGLRSPQERIAIEGFGQAIVVPWDLAIAQELEACALVANP